MIRFQYLPTGYYKLFAGLLYGFSSFNGEIIQIHMLFLLKIKCYPALQSKPFLFRTAPER
jgi:hypothetical protein